MAKKKEVQPAAAEAPLPVDIPGAARVPKIRLITRTDIEPDPEQPRKLADADLRNSIARNGLLQPITVRPHPEQSTKWMIVDGERRWHGSEGVLNDLPCIVRADMQALARRLITQLEANTGKALTPIEEAHAFKTIIDSDEMTIAQLHELTGRPKSTIAERLGLLEIGAWVELVSSGIIQMSWAIKKLLPLRGVGDDHHAAAVEKFREDFGISAKHALLRQEDLGLTFDDFEDFVRSYYQKLLYPLAKSKQTHLPQPTFATSKHDEECGCGKIRYDFSYGGNGERIYCGNPDWWKPRDAAAKKALKKAQREASPTGDGPAKSKKQLYLPDAATSVASKHGSAPTGVVQLTDTYARWLTTQEVANAFDPADLEIDDAKLVYWAGQGDYPCIGTKDKKAVEAARAKWNARLDEAVAQAREGLQVMLRDRASTYQVTGPGCALIIRQLDVEHFSRGTGVEYNTAERIADIVPVLHLEIPKTVLKKPNWERDDAILEWAATLHATYAGELLTALAMLQGEKGAVVPCEARRRTAAEWSKKIQAREIPWRKKPKMAPASTPKSAAKKHKRKALPLSKFSSETAELPLAQEHVDEIATCIICNCLELRACEGGCSWLVRVGTAGVCSRCARDKGHAKSLLATYQKTVSNPEDERQRSIWKHTIEGARTRRASLGDPVLDASDALDDADDLGYGGGGAPYDDDVDVGAASSTDNGGDLWDAASDEDEELEEVGA